jgi:hypothetical protein
MTTTMMEVVTILLLLLLLLLLMWSVVRGVLSAAVVAPALEWCAWFPLLHGAD